MNFDHVSFRVFIFLNKWIWGFRGQQKKSCRRVRNSKERDNYVGRCLDVSRDQLMRNSAQSTRMIGPRTFLTPTPHVSNGLFLLMCSFRVSVFVVSRSFVFCFFPFLIALVCFQVLSSLVFRFFIFNFLLFRYD